LYAKKEKVKIYFFRPEAGISGDGIIIFLNLSLDNISFPRIL